MYKIIYNDIVDDNMWLVTEEYLIEVTHTDIMTYCLDSYKGIENRFYCFDAWGVGSGNVKALKCEGQMKRI